jgi:hypothetical protein
MDAWHAGVTLAFVLGFVIAFSGALWAVVVTIREVARYFRTSAQFRRETAVRISDDAIDQYLRGEAAGDAEEGADERDDDRRRRRELNFALTVESVVSDTLDRASERAETMFHRIVRANAPAGGGVLVGAVITTVASIVALWPPE